MLNILLKNNQLFAVNKPAGLAVQTQDGDSASLQALAEAYCRHPLHLVNRIDQPVSGVVLFAKSPQAMAALTAQFKNRQVKKTYLALVQGELEQHSGTVVHFIVKKNSPKNAVAVVPEGTPGAQRAELEYQVLGHTDRYMILEISLVTGRHHQIRAQLAAMGCPVRGDVKYGARRGLPDRSITLHAWKLAFDHPVSGERIELAATLPEGAIWEAVNEELSK